jgi:hypothetical protein
LGRKWVLLEDPFLTTEEGHVNTLRSGDADLRLYAYKQFKYPVPNVLRCFTTPCSTLSW